MKPKDHKPGVIRYLTVWLIFPKDNERWVDQITFCEPISSFIKRTKLPDKAKYDLFHKGETLVKDKVNGMKFLYQIEETKRPRVWGINNRALHS